MQILLTWRPWELLLRSTALASAVTLLALLWGVPLGAILARVALPLRRTLLVLHSVPVFLPPFLLALGWFHLFGRQGLLGSATSAGLLFGPVGALLILALTFTPIVTALTALGVSSLDASLEDAARSVASPERVLARIVVPAAWPAIALAALLVFALSLNELAVPMFVRVAVYPAAIFARLGGVAYAPGEAAALGVPLLFVALLLVALERRLLGARTHAVLGLVGAPPPLRVARSKAAWAVCGLAAMLSVLPVLALLLRALQGRGFQDVTDWLRDSVQTGLATATLAASVVTLAAVVIGHGVARDKPLARLLDAVALMLFMLPSAVLGVGLIWLWNRPETQIVYATPLVLIVAYTARYLVLAVRTFAASNAQSSPSFEDAAAVNGAGRCRRLLSIVVPMHWRAACVAWLLTMVFCLRDLETVALIYPPGSETLPVRIFTLEANGPEATVAALSVVHVGVTLLAVSAGGLLLSTRSTQGIRP